MARLRKVGVMSLAKISAVIGLFFGLIFAIIAFFVFIATTALAITSGTQIDIMQIGFGLVGIILLPFIYAVSGFVGGALCAFLYNVFSGIIGGIEIELE